MRDPGLVPGAGSLFACPFSHEPAERRWAERGAGWRRAEQSPGGGRYLRSRRGPGTGHLGWAPHTFSAACGRGEPSSPALRADSEGARVRCRVRRAKVGAQWVRRGVCQGVQGAHASPSSTEGRLEVGALGALEGCWAATWE